MKYDSLVLRCVETSRYSLDELQAAWDRMEAVRKAKLTEKKG